jgi:hypothetical protein
MKYPIIPIIILMAASATMTHGSDTTTFGDEVAFLRSHTDIIVLSDGKGLAKVAVAPAWQGRVMTSTAGSDSGRGFGWINRALIASGKLVPHMNAFGGEDRFWLGPEGGQFSIYFAQGAKFDFTNWFVPAPFDTLPFQTVSQSTNRATFALDIALTNYSGTQFQVAVNREVRLLDTADAWKKLGLAHPGKARLVAYETDNRITNIGKNAWQKDTGLLSVWILGMFTPSPSVTIVVPIKPGPESELGSRFNPYASFGIIPPERLKTEENLVYFRGDGKFRSKIGISPRRSKGVLGAYDADNKVLTIVQFDQPAGVTEYVNSLWELQKNPYGGDVANSYNDGPIGPGQPPLGPFFEMESSSPAAALAPGESLAHLHRTIHLTGSEKALDPVARAVLGVSLAEIKSAFHSN